MTQATPRTDPANRTPGLHRPEAFGIFVAVMVSIAGAMLWWFRRRGWLGSRRR